MKQRITAVCKGSPAENAGIRAGDALISIDGNDIIDIVDYEQLTCCEHMEVVLEHENGEIINICIDKDLYEPFGLDFESSLMSPVRQCKNHCIFCFIDQLRPEERKTLHFKDDDWRLSLIMGNYVTLTNVDEAEFERIIARRVAPLYISVHATDGEIRKRMMRNPTADLIMQRLTRLRDEKLSFHAQIVLCPEINDGEVLEKTIRDLYSLTPYAKSVAVVPVGLTKHRKGLYPLRKLTREECIKTIDMVEAMQEEFLKESGTRFVFAADEMYTYSNHPLPDEECYEDYPQIENGVGLLRKFESELEYELDYMKDDIIKKTHGRQVVLHGATGISAYDFLQNLFDNSLAPLGIKIKLHPIRNDYFGESVTVSGLICACDIIAQLKGSDIKDLVIPHNMLRENDDILLDGMRIADIERELECKVHKLPCYDGGVFLQELVNNIDSIGEKIE